MKTVKTKFLFCMCLAAAFCASAFAGLDTIEIKWVAVDAGGEQEVTGYSDRNGVLVFDTQNPTGLLASQLSNRIWAYCAEKDEHISSLYKTYTVDALANAMDPDKAALLAQLWELHYDDSWESNTPIYELGGYLPGEPADTLENREALAFSFAVYEIIEDYDGFSIPSLDLSAGSLIANAAGTNPAAAITIAQDWLSALNPQYAGPLAQLVLLSHESDLAMSYQDVITEIPEPATIVLMVFGGVFLRIGKKTL